MGLVDVFSAFSQPSLQQLSFDDPRAWILVVGALVLAALVWLVATSIHRSFGLQAVDCPRTGGRAFVVVGGGRRAGRPRIRSCSLAPGRPLTCGTPCSAQIRGI